MAWKFWKWNEPEIETCTSWSSIVNLAYLQRYLGMDWRFRIGWCYIYILPWYWNSPGGEAERVWISMWLWLMLFMGGWYIGCIQLALVVEWLACLPVMQKIGVHFYLERESSATSGWINVGREWCCRGCWSIEGGTPGGLFRHRGGLPRIRKAWAARNVHECESVCEWNKNIVSAPKWLPCMNACMCTVFHCICICMCSN